MRGLFQDIYPGPLPHHMSDPVALVKQRIISSGEAGVLEEDAALQTLSLQGGVVLPLEGLGRGEHAAYRNTGETSLSCKRAINY